MPRAVSLLIALALASCSGPARTEVAPSESPTPTAAATASPPSSSSSPSHVPGTSVRVSVNGKEIAPGAVGELADDRASIITLAFPIAMDRASVDMWLPRDATIAWTDDRSVSLSVPATSPLSGFKIPEARSADGSVIVDLLIVAVQHAPSIVVSTFTVAELLAGATAPRPGAPRLRGSSRGTTVLPSPNAITLLVASLYDPSLASAQTFDLITRALATVSVPRTSAPYLVLGWAGSDRIAFVGERVWVATPGGASVREVADPGIAFLTAAAVSLRGSFVAAASRDKLVIVDLASGAVRMLSGYRNDCQLVSGPLTRIAWSPDEKRIAVVECESTAPTVVRTRIIDVATDRTVAVIDGGLYGIAPLLTGNFQASREYTEQGQGARLPWVVFDFAGAEKMRYLGRGPTLSPDGRYLLDFTCCAGRGFTLTDLVTQQERDFAGSAQWLRDGRVLVQTD